MNYFKKSVAALMVIIMLLTSVPLQGFAGISMSWLPSVEVEAAETGTADTQTTESQTLNGEEVTLIDTEKILAERNADKIDFETLLQKAALSKEEIKERADNFIDTFKNYTVSDEVFSEEAPMMFSMGMRSEDEEEQPVTSGTVNETVNWSYDIDTKTFTLSGTGDVPQYIPSALFGDEELTEEQKLQYIAPWDDYLFEIEKLVIGEGITSVGGYNFCVSYKLKDIIFSEGLVSIGFGCFAFCSRIKKLQFPSTLKSIGHYAFEFCSSLDELYFNDGFETLGSGCFYYYTILEKLYIPASFNSEPDFLFTISSEGELTVNSPSEIPIEIVGFSNVDALKTYKVIITAMFELEYGLNNNFVPNEDISEEEMIAYVIDVYNEFMGTSYDPANEEDIALLEEVFANVNLNAGYYVGENFVARLSADAVPTHELCKKNVCKALCRR